MTQPTKTPRCPVAVTVVRDAGLTELPVRVYRTSPCGLPLDTPTGGPCEFVYPNTGRGMGGFSGQTMTGCERAPEAFVHTTTGNGHHPYVSPLGCSIHGAAVREVK